MRAAHGQREHLGKGLLGRLEAELLQARTHVVHVQVAIFALLTIVGARIELVQAVIRQEVNPGFLWDPHNAVTQGEFRPVGDVYLLERNRA